MDARSIRLRMFFLAAAALAMTSATADSRTVMTQELMGRLVTYTQNGALTSLALPLCKALGVGNGTHPIPLRSVASDARDGKHYFALSLVPKSKDIFILVVRGNRVEAYLTDRSAKLRRAAVFENEKARTESHQAASPRFHAELSIFAKEAAAQLPPSR